MTLRQQIELLQAIEAGKMVQCRQQETGAHWLDVDYCKYNMISFGSDLDYRIKPEPRVVWVKYGEIHQNYPLECMASPHTGWVKFIEAVE